MANNRQSSQPDKNNGFTSRQELREAFQSAGAKYRRTPRKSGQDTVSATINVTCHLCQFNFEQPVTRSHGTICCPSCGIRFELKQHYQVDSVQIEQIEQELTRLRAEIETNYPQRSANREKSVIGPLPMQTVKKSFDWSEIARTDKQDKNSGFDAMVGRVRSALVHLENEQVDDYLRWRESFLRRKSQKNKLETIQVEMLEDRPSHIQGGRLPTDLSRNGVESGKRTTYADYSQSPGFQTRKTKLRVQFGVVGIILCAICVVTFFIVIWVGKRPQLASRESTPDMKLIEPTQTIDLSQREQHNTETVKENQVFQTAMEPALPNMDFPFFSRNWCT